MVLLTRNPRRDPWKPEIKRVRVRPDAEKAYGKKWKEKESFGRLVGESEPGRRKGGRK